MYIRLLAIFICMLILEENKTNSEVIEKAATDEIKFNDCYNSLKGGEYKKFANIHLLKNGYIVRFLRKVQKLALNSFDDTR